MTTGALAVILSEVSDANEVEGSRTGSRTRTWYRFPREAILCVQKLAFRERSEL